MCGRSNVLPRLRRIGEHHNTQTGRKPWGRFTMTSRRNVRRIAGAIAALSLVAAACGDDDDDDAAPTADTAEDTAEETAEATAAATDAPAATTAAPATE